jgi:hypothetical protein
MNGSNKIRLNRINHFGNLSVLGGGGDTSVPRELKGYIATIPNLIKFLTGSWEDFVPTFKRSAANLLVSSIIDWLQITTLKGDIYSWSGPVQVAP